MTSRLTNTLDLFTRDERAIGRLQKLRFFPGVLTGGSGCEVVDDQGRRLLDFSGAWGAASLGYGHPAIRDAVAEALRDQAGASVLSSANLPAIELAEALLDTLPELTDHKVWLGHSGSDANETALRAILAASGRKRVLSFAGAYHGGSAASMAISGHPVQLHADRHPGLASLPYPAPGVDAMAALETVFGQHPPEEFAAFFIEPIQSDGGMLVPAPGALAALVERCRAHGILIVCDEVKVGLARTGKMHAFRHEGFVPDAVTFGKGLGGGLPLSALVAPRDILDHASAFAMQTLQGNPISAAAGSAVLDTIQRTDLDVHAHHAGVMLLEKFADLKSRHPGIVDVRGRGLAIGVELAADQPPRMAAQVVYRAWELGLVIYYVGVRSNVLELTPPLILSQQDADRGVEILDQAIGDVAAGRFDIGKLEAFAGW